MNSSKSCGTFLPIAFVVLSGLGLLLNCSHSKDGPAGDLIQVCDYDINHFLLDQMARHRAVMLADAGHGSPAFMQGVVEYLNFWLDTLEHSPNAPEGVPTKLFLVLERDTASVANLKRYFSSGDLLETFGSGYVPAEQFTTADLEYYSDLRRFWKRVGAHNASAAGAAKPVSFDIFGPEKHLDMDNWSFEKRDSFFVHERDEYSSTQIIDLLEDNDDWKALIFYGGAHVNKAQAHKEAGKQSGEGYYLAHYVDEALKGDGGLATIYQGLVDESAGFSRDGDLPDRSYAVDIHRLRPDATTDGMKHIGADGFIIRFDERPEQRSVAWVKSETLVKRMIDSLAAWSSMSTDFTRYSFLYSLRYLTVIAGAQIDTMEFRSPASNPTTAQKWKDWYQNTDLDIVADLESGAPMARLVDYMSKSSGKWTNWYEGLIALGLGCRPYSDTASAPAFRAKAYRDRLEHDRRPILIDNLVHLLWIATGEERTKALQVLKRETGQDFVDAKDWMVWYRRNYELIWNQGASQDSLGTRKI